MVKKIVFLGSHGSGKTSTIELVKNRLESSGKSVETFVMGWKQFQNPILRMISYIYLKSSHKKNKKIERLERFKERSWIFYLIYYIELLTRYSKVKKSNAEFVLMDRYFYEELMFTQGLKRKVFKKLTPIPDETFVLEANSKTIRSRNHEVSEEMLENFYAKLHNLSKEYPMSFIDSSEKREKICGGILSKINDN